MIYRKNLYTWEQVTRLAAGCALVASGLIAFPGTWVGYGLAAGGAILAVTGIVGFCPMCAMVGRRPVAANTTSES